VAQEPPIRLLHATIVAAGFSLFLVGRVIMYPAALAPGGLLDRVRAESAAWDYSHRVLILAALLHIPAVLIICRALSTRTPKLSVITSFLLITGAALSIGQFALDYAVLAASTVEPASGDAVFAAFRNHPFVDLAFYKSPNITGLGFVTLAIALWLHAGLWRVASSLIAAMIVCSLVQSQFGIHGPRLTLLFQALAGCCAAAAVWRGTPRPTVSHG